MTAGYKDITLIRDAVRAAHCLVDIADAITGKAEDVIALRMGATIGARPRTSRAARLCWRKTLSPPWRVCRLGRRPRLSLRARAREADAAGASVHKDRRHI
jgi:hypothetical protein